MPGYNTDQFYNIVESGALKNTSELNPDKFSNPKFLFPGPTRKHSVNGSWVDKGGIQRGFIRMLTQTKSNTASEEMKKRRCFFQFNPQTIARSVQMRTDVAHPLTQDAGQFSTPLAGNTTFGFDILFDRSFELNRRVEREVHDAFQSGSGVGAAGGEGGGTDGSTTPFLAYQNSMLEGSPSDIGVLADIGMLDMIVGQGLTADMMNYIIERGKIQDSWTTSDTSVSTYTPDTTTGSSTTSTTSTTTSTNSNDSTASRWDSISADQVTKFAGNQAFLLPNPVRVVFSSLFMVDGFVTSMAVTYVKFNEAMVPMQCMVSVQMQAMYIGAAKNTTYLTWALENADQKPLDTTDAPVNTQADAATFSQLKDLLIYHLKNFKMINATSTGSDNWDNFTSLSFNTGYPYSVGTGFDYTSNAYITGTDSALTNRTQMDARVPCISGTQKMHWHFGFAQPEDKDNDKIYKEYLDGNPLTISYGFTLKVTRPRWGTYETTLSDDIVIYETSGSYSSTTSDGWNDIRRVKADLTNNAFTDSTDSRLFHWKSSSSGTDVNVWKNNRNGNKYIQSATYTVTFGLLGSVSDSKGNTVSFSANKTLNLKETQAISINVKPVIAGTGNPNQTTDQKGKQ